MLRCFVCRFVFCVALLCGFSMQFCAVFSCLLWVYMFVLGLVCGAIALDFCLYFVVCIAFRFFGLLCFSGWVCDLAVISGGFGCLPV